MMKNKKCNYNYTLEIPLQLNTKKFEIISNTIKASTIGKNQPKAWKQIISANSEKLIAKHGLTKQNINKFNTYCHEGQPIIVQTINTLIIKKIIEF